jgi:hypothetical protein
MKLGTSAVGLHAGNGNGTHWHCPTVLRLGEFSGRVQNSWSPGHFLGLVHFPLVSKEDSTKSELGIPGDRWDFQHWRAGRSGLTFHLLL